MTRLDGRRDGIGSCAAAMISVGAALLAVMMFTGFWPTRPNVYNSYVLQACAWLEGHLDVAGEGHEYLELAIFGGRYYVSFPPFPSYVMLPFAAIWGEAAPDGVVALAVTMLGVMYACLLYRRVRQDGQELFWVLFLYLGTGYVFIAMNGYVWFLAQTMCFTLSLMAVCHGLRGQGLASLSFWACAVGCRPMAAVYLPILLYLLWESRPPDTGLGTLIRRRWYWCLGPLIIGGSYMALNAARFGSVLEFGHNYLPEFTRETEGQFSLAYFTGNVRNLLRLPQWQNTAEPLVFYTFNGMAFWLIDPLFIPAAAAWIWGLIRYRAGNRFLLAALPVLTLVYVCILCCHRTLGGWCFGNRYLLDIVPWLFFGLCRWKPEGKWFRYGSVPLFCFGAALNLIGAAATYNSWIT